MSGRLAHPRVQILIANDFDDGAVVACLTRLRAEGCQVDLITRSVRGVRSREGLHVLGTLSLEQGLQRRTPHLVLLPGSETNVDAWMGDPRTLTLFQRVTRARGWVAVLRTAYPGLRASRGDGTIVPGQLLVQGREGDEEFVNRILARLRAPVAPGPTPRPHPLSHLSE